MLTRILNARLPLMVATPPRVFSLKFFSEIFRAGGLPVFDTEFMSDDAVINGAKQLEKEGILFALRLIRPNKTLMNSLAQLELSHLDALIFAVEAGEKPIRAADFGDARILLEITEINMNDTIDAWDPHALILKGNEAAGRVSRYSALILMQWYLKNSHRPVFIHGGVGRYTAAGMFAAGVSGVVLDVQLWLADASPLSDNFKTLLAGLDESDSIEISPHPGLIFRVFSKLGTRIARELKEQAIVWSDKPDVHQRLYKKFQEEITPMDDGDAVAVQSLFFLGQDALFAKSFKAISTDLVQMVTTFFKEIGEQLAQVDAHDPVVPDSPLARAHGTRLPLIQGPMANISDNADFAEQVLEAGALPFFAVGSLPESLADTMIRNSRKKIDTFGAGLVGIEAFNPAVNSHLEMVKRHKVPFALFAGGIPSQVMDLEKAGTRTYLHTPSISMLSNALKNGCTRFIFEGKEAGGHVGSLSSLVLWDAAVNRLLQEDIQDLSGISLIFAGGISTCFASWFISGMSAHLAARGALVGMQVGSAYLFTEEIIDTGAMKKRYQEIICDRDDTVVIGTTVGLASRTAPTAFAREMVSLETRMVKQGDKLEDRKRAFEKKNIGSLLIGAKGFLPDFKRPGEQYYTYFDDTEQEEMGNFLVGDSLAFFKGTLTIADIHDRYFSTKTGLYHQLDRLEIFSSSRHQVKDEIAIVGMGSILPGAGDPEALWDNIIHKRYAIKEMPDTRIRKDLYYDPDKSAEDRAYTMLAGLVEHYTFDRERFGYTEEKAARLSRSQQMLLEAAYQAVEDAGYLTEDLTFSAPDPRRTAVIIATCLGNELGNELQFKYHFPQVISMLRKLPEFQQLSAAEKEGLIEHLRVGMEGENPGYDPVHGILLNIEASRVARHLGLRGLNYIVDAACASSFTALDAAVGELLSGRNDQVIVGGVNTHLAPESFIGFCKMGALSARGSFPFDERADGFILGEGAAVFVLKRVKDAIRDGDQIHAVIKGIGSSSDGRGKAIAAPNIKGQVLALKRCYDNIRSQVTPDDISFVEAHGTSTIMGDQAELETLKQVYSTSKTGVSSVKSQIGHLLGGAGAAGLVKAVQAVKKGILPPNANFETLSPNHNLKNSEIYIITEAEPWEEPEGKTRKAGVSSYGFGGINYHLVIEEYRSAYRPLKRDIFTDPSYDFNDDRIVVAGLGLRLPGTPDVPTFWKKLQTDEKQFSDIPEERFNNPVYAEMDPESNYYLPMLKAGVITDFKFNNIKYRMPPTTVRSLERGQLLGLDAADEAITSAGLEKELVHGNRVGVILGTITGERQTKNILRVRKSLLAEIIQAYTGVDTAPRTAISQGLVQAIRDAIPENNEDTTPGLLSNIISGRIANHFGLNGANYVIDASCASAFVAISNAMRSLRFKELDFALAGGVDANLYPAVLMAFKRLGLLSSTTGRFFDDRADGYTMGEGAAIHLLTTRKKAMDAGMEILAELNQDAILSSVPDHLLAPSEQTFVSTINETYRQSGILKREIRHLDLFAFSNILGDMVEKQVVEKAFNHELACGNAKPQFGYFKAANPAVVMAKLVLMNRHRTLLPFRYLDPEHTTIKGKTVLRPLKDVTPAAEKGPVRFAFNVNGIGGNHCHMILSTLPERLTAASKSDNAVMISKAAPVRAAGGAASTAASAKTAAASDTLTSPAVPMKAATTTPFSFDGKHQRMVALLSGQGAQRPGMMKELYEADPDIRAVMDRGEAIFKSQRGYSLLEMMFGEDKKLNQTENTQPAIFLSSAALFERLRAQGFEPDYFIGHSVGEYTALFCSGMLGFDDAMRLILKRADLMKEAADRYPGSIMVVFRNEKETGIEIRESGIDDIWITNKNSENQTAVSGKTHAVDAFCEFLSQKNVIYKKLNLSAAFHTPLLQEAAEKLREYLADLTFNDATFSRVISNVTARPYPENRREVKDLLARQITSPVEFIRSIEYVYESGRTHYIEIGPGRLLANLLKNINIVHFQSMVTMDQRKGQVTSFEECKAYLVRYSSIFTRHRPAAVPAASAPPLSAVETEPGAAPVDEFTQFKAENAALADQLLKEEFRRRKREAAMDALERFDFNTDPIVISGVSVGLPGKSRRVFADDNFDRILDGTNFIEPLSLEDQKRITDKNITRLFKQPDGNARFVEITRTEDVIQLAGQLGYFSLTDEYGIKAQYDIAMALAVAAGIEALKDAGIPLVMQYKAASDGSGKLIPDGFALPREMQEETGVIITSLWPSNESLLNEVERYLYDRFYLKPYEEFENIYFYLMENVKEMSVKEKITDWFFKIRNNKKEDVGPYKFDRSFLMNACPLGSAHLAQIIRAKGPNTLISSACASTTQAIGIAEDWIRMGRCRRVLVIGGENATSEAQNQWIGTGFLALGAATVKKRVSEAAKPFDAERNGTILGAGAVGLVVETATGAEHRGMKGQAEVLGTHMANSAFHTFNIDVPHMAQEMTRFVNRMERQHGLKKSDYAEKLLFMSHETYTPARGGSADAEVMALKTAFNEYLNSICISNTKGFTGHTLGAAIEDVVMVKALQKRKAPPIANLTRIPDHFKALNFSGREKIRSEYGLHLAAGFGSHFAFLLVRRIQETDLKNNPRHIQWLREITGATRPELKIINNTLCAVPGQGETVEPARTGQVSSRNLPASHARPRLSMPEGGTGDVINIASTPAGAPPRAMTSQNAAATGETASPTAAGSAVSSAEASPDAGAAPDAQPQAPDTAPRASQGTGESATAAPVAGGPAAAEVMNKVKEIIAEQTGYTIDMLEDTLDLEADLGIDTVKQVEIFAKTAGHFGFPVPEDLKLRDLNTIAKLADYINTQVGTAGGGDGAVSTGGTPDSSQGPGTPAQAPDNDLQVSQATGGAATDATVAGGPAAAEVMNKVKEIIAEQTGYTTDMLEDTLDLEADLGIDTVKQVEIFAKTAGHFGFPVPEDLKLRDLNTIAKLADYINSQVVGWDDPEPPADPQGPTGTDGGGPASGSGSGDPNQGSGSGTSAAGNADAKTADPAADRQARSRGRRSPIKRLVPVLRPALGVPMPTMDPVGKTFFITLDAHGYGLEAAAALKDTCRIIGLTPEDAKDADPEIKQVCDAVFPLDTGSGDALEKGIAALLAQYPDPDGVLHLSPLDLYGKSDDIQAGVQAVHTFFHVMKALFSALNRPGTLVAAMAFGDVVFPYADPAHVQVPALGGISAMIKSIAKELPDTRFKMVDFSAPDDRPAASEVIPRFLAEIFSEDDRVETGFKAEDKYVLKLEEPPPATGDSDLIRTGDTLVVTGGARGITFEIIKAVVAEYQTPLVLIGRSPIDALEDRFLAPGLTGPAIMGLLKDTMPDAKPVALKKEADRILAVRASRDNLEFLRNMGVSVTYRAADVADPEAVSKALSGIERVDGVIHAAGLEESMPFDKKTHDAFTRVLHTKVMGCANVMAALADHKVRCHIGFSSVTAKFGNEGQADYTAANDMLSRMLFKTAAESGTACKVMDWTAWSGAGMATRDTVKKVLTERGLTFLPLEEGVDIFMAEMTDAVTPEVVITGLDTGFDRDGLLKVAPFLDQETGADGKEVVFSRHLTIDRDRFLLDHAMEGIPIFLGATGVETMAQAALAARRKPGCLNRVSDYAIPYGIKLLQNRPKDIQVTAAPVEDHPDQWQCRITSQFINPAGMAMGDPKLHYQAVMTVTDAPLPARNRTLPDVTPVKNGEKLARLIYHPQRLFMEGVFDSIHDIVSFDGSTLICRLSDTSDAPFFNTGGRPPFLTDVVLLDGMFQTGGAYEFFTDSCVVLPFKIGSLEFFSRGVKHRDYLCLTTRTASDDQTDTYDMDLVDTEGAFLMKLRDFQMVKLHKLPPEHTISSDLIEG